MTIILDYNQVYDILRHLQVPDATEGFVGIGRAGGICAMMLSTYHDKPGFVVHLDRFRKPVFIYPEIPHRIILVDDVVRTGNTFRQVKASLDRRGHQVTTLSIVVDTRAGEATSIYWKRTGEFIRFPWDETEFQKNKGPYTGYSLGVERDDDS